MQSTSPGEQVLAVWASNVSSDEAAMLVIQRPATMKVRDNSASSNVVHPVPIVAEPAPQPEQLAEIDQKNVELESASAAEILTWATDRFRNQITMATAFGPEGMVIIHFLARVAPTTAVFNLDTGYQFPETLAMIDRIRQRYGMEVKREQAAQ
jgi:phosphoadenosine phosphosulfate reductase